MLAVGDGEGHPMEHIPFGDLCVSVMVGHYGEVKHAAVDVEFGVLEWKDSSRNKDSPFSFTLWQDLQSR